MQSVFGSLPLKVKVIDFNYDISTTGSLAITGVGFKPKTVILFGCIDASAVAYCWGLSDGTAEADMINMPGYNWTVYSNVSRLYTGAGVFAQLSVASFDADGLTFTKAKTGLPTGTGYFYALLLG
jgi:hypothetical protein